MQKMTQNLRSALKITIYNTKTPTMQTYISPQKLKTKSEISNIHIFKKNNFENDQRFMLIRIALFIFCTFCIFVFCFFIFYGGPPRSVNGVEPVNATWRLGKVSKEGCQGIYLLFDCFYSFSIDFNWFEAFLFFYHFLLI